jgi:hypothetical protein
MWRLANDVTEYGRHNTVFNTVQEQTTDSVAHFDNRIIVYALCLCLCLWWSSGNITNKKCQCHLHFAHSKKHELMLKGDPDEISMNSTLSFSFLTFKHFSVLKIDGQDMEFWLTLQQE